MTTNDPHEHIPYTVVATDGGRIGNPNHTVTAAIVFYKPDLASIPITTIDHPTNALTWLSHQMIPYFAITALFPPQIGDTATTNNSGEALAACITVETYAPTHPTLFILNISVARDTILTLCNPNTPPPTKYAFDLPSPESAPLLPYVLKQPYTNDTTTSTPTHIIPTT